MASRSLAATAALGGLLVAVAYGCGGQIAGGGDGGPGSTGSSGGGTTSSGGVGATSSSGLGTGPGLDASAARDAPFVGFDAGPPTVLCSQQGGAGSGSSGGCSVQETETCSDGFTYSVTCSCPSGTCTCSESSNTGGSTGGGTPFAGCPSCPGPDQMGSLWSVCGFPH